MRKQLHIISSILGGHGYITILGNESVQVLFLTAKYAASFSATLPLLLKDVQHTAALDGTTWIIRCSGITKGNYTKVLLTIS